MRNLYVIYQYIAKINQLFKPFSDFVNDRWHRDNKDEEGKKFETENELTNRIGVKLNVGCTIKTNAVHIIKLDRR